MIFQRIYRAPVREFSRHKPSASSPEPEPCRVTFEVAGYSKERGTDNGMQDTASQASGALALVDDALFSEHRSSEAHPERPERLDAARAAVQNAKLGLEQQRLAARDASDDELSRVHDDAYLEALGRMRGRSGWLDGDTYVAPRSVEAARRAAGGALALTDALLDQRARHGVALLRPPGHHARPGTGMGFCLLNNVGVAAAHARARGTERVAIVDWDVHHGNGTQEMFYDDPSVLYVSLHQFPFYPGTGAADEVGEGAGVGYTVNVPLSAGADDTVYLAAFDRIVCPVMNQFDPDLVLVSAGFDAHHRDPLAAMDVTDAGYAAMTRRLTGAIPRGAGARLGLLLEGGYDLTGLRGALQAALEALGPAPPESGEPLGAEISPRHAADLARAKAALSPHWKL
jgi:acetoin utilization deacetylase AcuC-like enzyme